MIVVINDLHAPYVNNRLLFKIYDFIKENEVEEIIINGDLLDCWELSSFDRIPRGGETFDYELKMGEGIIKTLRREAPKAKITYIEGNHSFRLRKYIITQAPALWGIEGLDLPGLLHLKDYGVEWVGTNEGASRWQDTYVQRGDIYIGHFNLVRQHSAYTAKALVDKYGVSVIQAHVHRGGVYYKTLIDGRVLMGVENFCVCDLNPPYLSNANWQNGFTIIKDGLPIPIPFLGDKLII